MDSGKGIDELVEQLSYACIPFPLHLLPLLHYIWQVPAHTYLLQIGA